METPKVKFLIIRLSSIGDIVLTTPVVRALKQQVDGAEIHYLVKPQFKNILASNPYINKIHEYTTHRETKTLLKQELFDYVIDLHNNFRTKRLKNSIKVLDFTVDKINFKKFLLTRFKINRLPDVHIVDRYLDTLKVFDVKNDSQGLDYFYSKQSEKDFEVLPLHDKYISLAIGGQHYTKQMPIDLLGKLCSFIDRPIVLLGGRDDVENGNLIVESSLNKNITNFCGKVSLDVSALIIKNSVLLITHDTGLMHIGAAFKKTIFSIWGNTVPDFGMYPYMADKNSEIFQVEGLKCRPCSKIGCKNCPKTHFKCMREQDIRLIANKSQIVFDKNDKDLL
ncbi:MAG: glycosyltransferase family 9 protein [Bacteroidales bacterium]|jgi:ADP-heptose:LPS heptosyltransferase|nr:glycosyltransferase family 9 protein [Bacteroidales bacterium]